ncbi:hypothetical protein P7M77_21675 [Vibrio parahaemolyticus]|uniref:hypothetical protein n=1 Tax=Vibrio TaxID=662 RepID=UPI000A1F3F42|nr:MULTISPECIES: hypothetical protein [Vibrio]EKO3704491.1 hypothetical protein [Vibrio metschnikovii]HDI3321446.1 hypothetical protein [Vibrio cholerae]EGQ7796064.1 hypothetical protein [Vibrio parahaemolyticus]EIN4364522.1 hypothetical protein [Vibrio parahaemolyticus]MCC8255422.1 hypothetical protein [Vibrio campbellii CAIM 333]
MTESAQSSKVKVSPGFSVGGASTAVIAAYNAWGDPQNAAFIATAVPVVIGALFWLSEYAFSAIGLRPLAELKILRSFDSDIKNLEKRMKKAQKLGYSQDDVNSLIQQHKKLVIARSEMSSSLSKVQAQ